MVGIRIDPLLLVGLDLRRTRSAHLLRVARSVATEPLPLRRHEHASLRAVVAEDASTISTVVPSGKGLEPRSAGGTLINSGIGLPGRRPLLELGCGGLAGASLHDIVPGTGRPSRLVASSREALGRGASSWKRFLRRRGGEVVEAAGVEVGHCFLCWLSSPGGWAFYQALERGSNYARAKSGWNWSAAVSGLISAGAGVG